MNDDVKFIYGIITIYSIILIGAFYLGNLIFGLHICVS